jgi:membrane-associated phospholipid phosphatase
MNISLWVHWLPIVYLTVHTVLVLKSEYPFRSLARILAVNAILAAYFLFSILHPEFFLGELFPGSKILFLWSPVIFFWWAYMWSGHMLRAFHPPTFTYDPQIIAFEEKWFGQPSLWWARKGTPWVTDLMQFFYFTYFFYTFGLGLYLHAHQRIDDFQAMTFATAFGYLISYTFFAITPAKGPRWALIEAGLLSPSEQRQKGYVFTKLVEAIMYDDVAHKGGAMPSAHSSTAVVFLFWCWYIWGWEGGMLALIIACGMWLGAIYGRYHYALDIIVGALLGVASLLVAGYIFQ